MDREQYKEKLKQFNSTQKYLTESDFLFRMISPQINEKILDYGCGLGRMVKFINENSKANCFGYDIRNLEEEANAYLYRTEYFFKFDKVFFLHSFAHIPDIEQKLIELKELLNPGAKIYVLTPNKMWLEHIHSPNYVKDPTVVSHFYILEIKECFEKAGYKITLVGQLGEVLSGYNERIFLEATI